MLCAEMILAKSEDEALTETIEPMTMMDGRLTLDLDAKLGHSPTYWADDKKFRLQATCVMFTYATHIDKKMLIKFLSGKLSRGVEDSLVAHELGKKKKYLHTHAIIKLDRRCDTKKPDTFDWECEDGTTIHPHILPFQPNLWKQKVLYLCKEDPENKERGGTTSLTLAQLTWAKKDQAGALSLATSFQEITGILALYALKPAVAKNQKCILKRWQNRLFDRIQYNEEYEMGGFTGRNVDDSDDSGSFEFISGGKRKIIWVWDIKGCCGKTIFAQELIRRDPVRYTGLTSIPQESHLATIIEGSISRGWDGSVVLICLSRQAEDYKIYKGLEDIRDGHMTSTKYHGKYLSWTSQHVVVLANWLPNFSALTWDKWELYTINKKTKQLETMTLDEGIKARNEYIAAKEEENSLNEAYMRHVAIDIYKHKGF